MEERTLAERLCRLRSQPAPTTGPLVSIVVANRDGAHHLRRLLDGLDERTNYENIEVVMVDNASHDESVDLIEQWSGPARVLRNATNHSFSATNNQGVKAATGDLVLLANNDIDPIHPDWLGYMVESLLDGAGAVGAMLVYPSRERQQHAPDHPDLTVQHLGTAFQRSRWGVRAANIAIGTDPLAVDPTIREVPAVTAACLLARRTDLLDSPLDEEYWYGTEDWDLCLRLRQAGPIVVDERAVLFHHEYGTQDSHMSEEWLAARTRNHHWFNDLWGPSLRRELRREVLGPRSEYFFRDDHAPRVLLVSNPKRRRTQQRRWWGQAKEAGWEVVGDEKIGADIVVAVDVPRRIHRFASHDLSVAVVLDHHEEWARSGALDGAKRILVPDRVGEMRVAASWGGGIAEVEPRLADATLSFDQLLAGSAPAADAMRIGVSTAAPDWEKAQVWGDTFLARGLMRAFRRLGHEASELIQPDWRSASAASCDVVVHLRGLHRRPVARGQWNILWIISHPDRIDPDEYDDYDVVATASLPHAEELSERLGRQVHFVPQATDADTFRIGRRDVDFEAPVLYVGIARWPNRRAPRWMARNHRPFHLYGRNWERHIEGATLRGEFIANRDLASAYRSASIVVADHHGTMRTGGFVANRLFDVLASGGLVLSDDVAGIEELFGETVPTYSNARELESQIRVLLSDDALRRRLSSQGRRIVQEHHTLDHRAAEFLRLLDEL